MKQWFLTAARSILTDISAAVSRRPTVHIQSVLPDRDYYFAPARAFEERHGMTGISKAWALPNDASFEAMQQRFLRECGLVRLGHPRVPYEKLMSRFRKTGHLPHSATAVREVSLRYLDHLCELNPELRKIAFNRQHPFDAYHVVLGCLSQYNADDISYFIHEPEGAIARAHRDVVRAALPDAHWVLSPTTFQSVRNSIAQSAPSPPPSRPAFGRFASGAAMRFHK